MIDGRRADRPLLIAHRGASGYLPEHTLPAKALAFGLGADYLEQDVVATRDDELVVLHDVHLDTVTDVARRFPDRSRDDGRWYARDFDLAEIRQLNVHERRDLETGEAVFPERFPTDQGRFAVPSLAEEIDMIRGLNRATGRDVGIYPEIKKPAWHHQEGVDLASLLLDVLDDAGYRRAEDAVFLQCFDAEETRRLRKELRTELRVVQLVADNTWGESTTDYDKLLSPDGLDEVADYADGLGPWLMQLYDVIGPNGAPVDNGVTRAAQDRGLAVHPYTFRADQLPPGFADFAALVRWFAANPGVDGLFTDFVDQAAAAL